MNSIKPFVRKEAWDPDALVEAGFDPQLVRTWLVSGPNAVPERARLSLHGRKRTIDPTTRYVWGPDLEFLAAGKVAS